MKLIKDLGVIYPTETSKTKVRCGIYECPYCKIHFKTRTATVKYGSSTKCRKCSLSLKGITHGDSKARLYNIFNHMIARTTKPNNKNYVDYGGRGITVCNEWLKYENFREWALNNDYEEHLTIDRINVNGNYEPSNCRWVNRTIQARNQRKQKGTSTEYKGVTKRQLVNSVKYESRITVDKKCITLGFFDCRLAAAYAYDEYVTKNNLEHTRNFN